ncbi:MAG: hypothetical protein HZA50_16725 [Planctomycetes bacterium]|nr:hypothetical protein [Planctomycetota bacterium]
MRKFSTIALILCLAAAAGCGKKPAPVVARSDEPVSEYQAKNSILYLPQTIEFARKLDAGSQGKSSARTSVRAGPSQCGAMGLPPSWLIDVIEFNSEGTRLWTRFRIDVASGAIYVWNPIDDSYMTLRAWQDKVARGISQAYNTASQPNPSPLGIRPGEAGRGPDEGNLTNQPKPLETIPAAKPNLPLETPATPLRSATTPEVQPVKPPTHSPIEEPKPVPQTRPAQPDNLDWNLSRPASVPSKTDLNGRSTQPAPADKPPSSPRDNPPATQPTQPKSPGDWNLPARK